MASFDIVKPKGATRKSKLLGRGAGSGRGCTAGKGDKGQNSRSGGGTRLGFEGGQMPLYRRIARRGFSNHPFKTEYFVVTLRDLSGFKDGETVNRESLKAKGLIGSKMLPIKVLGSGQIKTKLSFAVDKLTAGAAAKITAAGGTIAQQKSSRGK